MLKQMHWNQGWCLFILLKRYYQDIDLSSDLKGVYM